MEPGGGRGVQMLSYSTTTASSRWVKLNCNIKSQLKLKKVVRAQPDPGPLLKSTDQAKRNLALLTVTTANPDC